MNRRILLIDADPGFFQTLSDALRGYAFDVVNEADPDQAILLAGAEAPALLVVGVDEPDKLGFKVFQRCKKGGLAKVPIMLVTSSVSPESFAKHRGLKTHADEYLDKRTVSREDLLAKIDALISIGAPVVEDSLDVPIEIDEIPMGDDGDMVLEEEVGGDEVGGDFGDDPHASHSGSVDASLAEDAHPEPAPPSRRMDSMVDADIENAFGGLLGDDYVEPTAEPIPEPVPEPEPVQVAAFLPDEPIPEAVPEPEPVQVSEFIPDRGIQAEREAVPERLGSDTMPPPMHDDAEPSVLGAPVIDDVIEEAVPSALPDGELAASEDDVNEFENFNEQATRGPRDLDDLEGLPVAQVPMAPQGPARFESSPAIALDEDDIQPIEEELLPIEEESAVLEPVPHLNVREAEPEPEPAPPPPPPEPTRPRFIETSTGTNLGAAPAPPRPQGVLNVVDLGLDRIAEDADRDQSGLHDRRELRKIHELERQITQLKAEVERTRASAESTTRPAGREGEFLKLRENLLNQGKDLQKAKDEIAARDRELADVAERLRQAHQAASTLEAKTVELEQRSATDSSRVAAVEARERALSAQLATVQQELSAKTQAADHAETVRAQLERDVANERALRASSSSEAERTLRVEREQMIVRHQGELAAARAEAASAQELALAALHAELAAAHATALAAAADAGRREIAVEAEAAVAQLEQRQTADLKRLEDEYTEALAEKMAESEAATEQARAETARVTAQLQAEHAATLAKLAAQHQAELGRLQSDLGGQVVAASTAHDHAIAELREEIARLGAAQSRTEAQHVEELHAASANQAAALAEQATLHGAALAKRDKESAAAREAETAAHAAALAELRAELERQAAALDVKLELAKREHEQLLEQQELARTQLAVQQQRDAEAVAAQHQAELAKVAEDKQRAIDDIQRASAEHRAAVEKSAAQGQGELAARQEAAERELGELRTALQAAKQAIEDATAKHTAEREAAAQVHSTAIGELTAQHERALAVAHGEVVRIKAVGDAEHGRALAAKEAEYKTALAAKEAEHQRAVADTTAERDELRKGLSGSRDAHKRTESELAAAVQTIADRNSELRSHAQAVAERDQRIAELRKEIDTVETENASYQEQVLRAYQKIKTDEAMVARAKKAMAIALTVLDDQGQPKES